jgi:hypothetical protein
MTLQEKLAAYKAEFLTRVPPETVHTMKRATQELQTSGILEKVLTEGDRAPEFALPDQNGRLVSSRQLLAKGPLVVSFYRGTW